MRTKRISGWILEHSVFLSGIVVEMTMAMHDENVQCLNVFMSTNHNRESGALRYFFSLHSRHHLYFPLVRCKNGSKAQNIQHVTT